MSWDGFIKQVLKEINDPKIYSLFFPYQNKTGHPKIKENKDMADILIKFIDEHNLLPKLSDYEQRKLPML